MKFKFSIGNIVIGKNEEPLVIPEMGINHEGSLEVAKLIIDAAYRSGAKIIKHQTHVVDDEMSHAAKMLFPVTVMYLFMMLWNVVHFQKMKNMI